MTHFKPKQEYSRPEISLDDLNHDQRALLVHLVNFGQQRKIGPMLVPIPRGPMDYVVYVYGESSFHIERLSDLDALCGAGCLDYRLNRMGNAKVYLLTETSYEVAELWRTQDDFEDPPGGLHPDPVAETVSQTKELLYRRWGELQQRLPANLPTDIRQRLFFVMDELVGELPSRSRISFQLRRIGRHLLDGLHNRQSARLLLAYSRWVRAIYEHLP